MCLSVINFTKKDYENTQKTLRKHSPRGLHPTSGRAVRLKRGMNPEQTVEQEKRNSTRNMEQDTAKAAESAMTGPIADRDNIGREGAGANDPRIGGA